MTHAAPCPTRPVRTTRLAATTLAAAMLAAATLAACADATSPNTAARSAPAAALSPAGVSASLGIGRVTHVDYDARDLADYRAKWTNIYGPGELAAGGTLAVTPNGGVTVTAVPFRTASDASVFDHLKYIGVSAESFPMPTTGSLTFSVDITASTPGAADGRVIHGCYGPSGSYQHVGDPCAKRWSATTYQGQQAAVVLNMINFATGQLFDWFVAGDEVFALIERLPSNVTGSPGVGLDKAYTQIIRVAPVKRRETHNVAITYVRGFGVSAVLYTLDGLPFAAVDHVGIPLDVQRAPFTGTYPSLGHGEALGAGLDSFVIGHGLFSVLDAFPFQHPDRPDLSVSIPLAERAFGQGAQGTFKNFRVTTTQ